MTALSQTSIQRPSIIKDLSQIIGGSLLICLCSQIRFILPFTPVPITFQTFAILLIGASLGSWKGACAVLCYFAEILMGLPVLSGGTSDPLVFLGPKGGYVLGFCMQAYLMGWFVERTFFSRPLALLIGGLIACSAQLALGLFILALYVGWNNAWTMGLFPFIPGELLKIFLLTYLSKSSLTKSCI